MPSDTNMQVQTIDSSLISSCFSLIWHRCIDKYLQSMKNAKFALSLIDSSNVPIVCYLEAIRNIDDQLQLQVHCDAIKLMTKKNIHTHTHKSDKELERENVLKWNSVVISYEKELFPFVMFVFLSS